MKELTSQSYCEDSQDQHKPVVKGKPRHCCLSSQRFHILKIFIVLFLCVCFISDANFSKPTAVGVWDDGSFAGSYAELHARDQSGATWENEYYF